jgi:signal transduction histidine kinase
VHVNRSGRIVIPAVAFAAGLASGVLVGVDSPSAAFAAALAFLLSSSLGAIAVIAWTQRTRRLAAEQAALRRVATLVAGDAQPAEVFQAVTEAVCRVYAVPEAVLERYEDEKTTTIVGRYGGWTAKTDDFQVGNVIPLAEGLAAFEILRTGAPVRIHDFGHVGGDLADRMRKLGLCAVGGVPITVAGAPWGALIAGLGAGQTMSRATERRMGAFAELAALAVASAQARAELAASRRRIVESADVERKRIERNLHDAVQQRLTSIALTLGLAESRIDADVDAARRNLVQARQALAVALAELRDLSQGIHPSVLTEGGLEPALEDLAYTTPLPIRVVTDVNGRLPEQVEAGAYYVIAEALTNVAKHARASTATVTVRCEGDRLSLSVRDDGVGGADPGRGSGLRGLGDRVHALGGTFELESRAGAGTEIRAAIPCA